MKRVLYVVSLLLLLCASAAQASQSAVAVAGRVTDPADAVVVGAVVVLKDASGAERRTATDAEGRYSFHGLAPGTYSLRVEAEGFKPFERAGVEVVTGERKRLDVRLAVGLERQEVTVGAEGPLGVEPDGNRSALRLGEAELDALPEDPEELAAALQSLAGAPVGPSGGQILIDGFLNTGEPLPPRGTIREVRINQNPFSAENDRLGFGQIQIITRAGTEKLRGQLFFNFNDESLNSRNPFAPSRAAYRMRTLGGNLGGTLAPRRASFFLSLEERVTDDNALVNAVVLDEGLTPVPLVFTAAVPRRQVNAGLPAGMRLSPLVFASSGRPFNISSGADTNGDSFLTDRPALATDLTRATVRVTPFGAFDTEPPPGQSLIPRNYGEGPGYFVVNLNVSRTFSFGRVAAGSGAGGAGAGGEARYRLTTGLRFTNLFNRVSLDLPVGNLGSPLFGRAAATAGGFGAGSVGNPAAGNRRVEAQLRFEF